jgi:hypothetical protein
MFFLYSEGVYNSTGNKEDGIKNARSLFNENITLEGLNIHTGLAYNVKFICWHLVLLLQQEI